MWFFTNPRIVLGAGSIEFLASLQRQKALLICDADVARLGIPERLADPIRRGGGQVRVFDGVVADPPLDIVEKALGVAREFQPDLIVGCGGGSSMDVAKATYALYERPDLTVYDLHPLTELKLGSRALLVGVPTTSGSGSETTWAVVLTEGPGGRKLEFAHRELVPAWCILDPLLPSTMPPRVTADTGADALAHAIEAVASDWRNPFSDAYARDAVSRILAHLPRAVRPDPPLEVREQMHYAAAMAGMAFSNSQVGICHAMAHALGSIFRVPHGRCVGTTLPYAIEFNFRSARERYEPLAPAFGVGAISDAQTMTDRLRRLWDAIGMPQTLEEMLGVGISEFEKRMPELVTRADQSTCVTANPRIPSSRELEQLFWAAWRGERVGF
jgi:alcohol dehydrogenase class IV